VFQNLAHSPGSFGFSRFSGDPFISARFSNGNPADNPVNFSGKWSHFLQKFPAKFFRLVIRINFKNKRIARFLPGDYYGLFFASSIKRISTEVCPFC